MSTQTELHATLIKMPDTKPALCEYSPSQKERLLDIEIRQQEIGNMREVVVIETFKQESLREHVTKSVLVYQTICEDKVMDETARQIFKDCIIKNVQSIKDDTKGASELKNCALRDEIFAWYAAKAATAT